MEGPTFDILLPQVRDLLPDEREAVIATHWLTSPPDADEFFPTKEQQVERLGMLIAADSARRVVERFCDTSALFG